MLTFIFILIKGIVVSSSSTVIYASLESFKFRCKETNPFPSVEEKADHDLGDLWNMWCLLRVTNSFLIVQVTILQTSVYGSSKKRNRKNYLVSSTW